MPDLIQAIPGLLQGFSLKLRQEAERLVEDDAVVALDILPDEVTAEVGLDDRTVSVRWLKGVAGWKGRSDAPEDLNDLVLCVVLVAAVRRETGDSAEAEEEAEEQFEAWLESRLGRQLTDGELGYIEKVEKRFLRVRAVGEIYDQDMVRLHPKWTIESMDALELWPQMPGSMREFWGYVAFALDQKGLAIPMFMRSAMDPEEVKGRLLNWKKQRELPRWKDRVRRVAREVVEPEERGVEVSDFRLMISSGGELRLQRWMAGEGSFRTLGLNELDTLHERHRRGQIVGPTEGDLLLHACLTEYQQHGARAMRLDEEPARQLLLALLQREDLKTRLVTLDEVPLRRVESPLHWEGVEADDGETLRLNMITHSGAEAPLPLRVLRGAETYYLSEEAVYRGPLWFGEGDRMEDGIEVPMAAIASEDGVLFLRRLGVELPPGIASKVVEAPLDVRVHAKCLAKSPVSSAEYAVIQLNAVDEKGRVVERLLPGGWEPWGEPTVEDEGSIVCRDRGHLSHAEQMLGDFRATFDPEQQGYRIRMTKQFPDQFLAWSQSLPGQVTLTTDDRLESILADPLIARVRLEAKQTESIDWFDLQLVFDIEGAELKPAEIRRLVAARGGFVRFADGSWKRVELQLTDEQQEMIDQLGIELTELGDEIHRLHWRQLAGDKASELIQPNAWKNISERLEKAKIEEQPPVPEELKVTLRPYQVEGYHFLAYLTLNRFGGILADDMGLGKTLQSIAWILWLRNEKRRQLGPGKAIRPALVVCPKSVLDVWGAEFVKATSELRVQVLREKDAFDLEVLENGLDVLVVNYAQLRGLAGELAAVRFMAVILDEGQQIKNPDSLAARAARQLKADNRLVLTGTPLENRLLDLWSLMTFATPGSLGDRRYFQKHFDRRKDGQAAARLSARLRPFLLRRTKSQVARDLPPRSEEAMICEMSEEQATLYRAELARAQQMVLTASSFEALQKSRFAVLQALTRLRQICCHPSLIHAAGKSAESAKLTATLELIQELHDGGHKVLLFSQFVTMLTLIRERLEEMGLPFHWLTGSTQDRAGVVDRFQTDEKASVFLISLKAGGSGLNLTAASYVILYDPWWNPAVEAQAIDRAHRIGQTQPVMAYRMITKGTIEEKIMLLQQKKQMMAGNILGEGAFSSTLDRNDFAYLFDLEQKEAELQRDLKDRSYEKSLKGEF